MWLLISKIYMNCFYYDKVGEVQAEMVWFKHPDPAMGDPLSMTWKENVMFTGPDAFFRYEEIPVGGSLSKKRFSIFSTQYFSEQIVVSWTEGITRCFHRQYQNYHNSPVNNIVFRMKKELIVSMNKLVSGAFGPGAFAGGVRRFKHPPPPLLTPFFTPSPFFSRLLVNNGLHTLCRPLLTSMQARKNKTCARYWL